MAASAPTPAAPQDASRAAQEALGAVDAALREALTVVWVELAAPTLTDSARVIERLDRLFTGLKGDVFGAIRSTKAWEHHGAKDLRQFLQSTTGGSSQRVTRDVRLAEAVDPKNGIPAARAALHDGQISHEHVATITEFANTATLKEQLSDPTHGGASLVELAKTQPISKFRKSTHAWRNRFDPERADADSKDVHLTDEFWMRPDPRHPNRCKFGGSLANVRAAEIDAVLTQVMGRRPADDDRSPDARRLGALEDVIRMVDTGATPEGVRPGAGLTVIVPFETLHAHARAAGSGALPTLWPATPPTSSPLLPPVRLPSAATLTAPGGPRMPIPDPALPNSSAPDQVDRARAHTRRLLEGLRAFAPGDPHVISTAIAHEMLEGFEPPTLLDGTPLAPWEFGRHACNASLSRVVLGPTSIILDAGRSRRFFGDSLTRAIVARDRHCQMPGCTAPPKYCEVHHSLHWGKHLGETNAELGCLLCFGHHDDVHRLDISILRFDGKWFFYTAAGELMTPDSHGLSASHTVTEEPPEAWLRPSQQEYREATAPDFLLGLDDDHHK